MQIIVIRCPEKEKKYNVITCIIITIIIIITVVVITITTATLSTVARLSVFPVFLLLNSLFIWPAAVLTALVVAVGV